ncbi:MAG TPA: hypothetical protein VH853_02300 [Polyangia bacterium]|jgi:hypothetical protein|nr:hypothetical protein [Polyangia bacterium]
MSDGHRWTFFRAGGFDQVKLASGADLANLGALDQKLWVALACPTIGLEIDARTLALIDTDKDGRVRAPELVAAVTFACANLRDPNDLFKGAAALPLASINDALPAGRTLLASARRILADIGKPESAEISLEDVGDPARIFADTVFNGDGVITETAAEDDATRALILEIGETIGSVADRSGKPGIDGPNTDAFFAEARAFSAWHARGEESPANVFPLGPEPTAAAAAAVAIVKPRVDDYFGRCRLAAFDPRALSSINRNAEEYLPIAAQTLTISVEEIAGFPLALAAAERPLPLAGPVNPAHAAALRTLRDDAVGPLLGARAQLTESDWLALGAKLAPYEAWLAVKEGQRVEKLGVARVREILASGGAEVVAGLLARDKALEAEAASIGEVERLVRYHRDLVRLCTNFVSFEDFYDGRPAIFQYGTLYLDQRACHLCLPVADAAKHATMVGLAGAFLAYLDCTRPATSEKVQIVAAFTAGDSDNLMIGRNGVFYDRQGRDWDATITKIVDNPISLRQAFWAPYKKFVRLLEEQVAKRAAAADAESHGVLTTAATGTANVGNVKPPEAKKIDVGTVAALGVAVGAIGTFATALIGYATGLFKMGPLAIVGAFVGIMLLISLPSVVLAYIKLRKRNLGPILDANGWAVNTRAKINVPFGATLSSVAKLPRGSRRDTSDRYAEKSFPWKSLLFVGLLLYGAYTWYGGKLDRLLPEPARSTTIFPGR